MITMTILFITITLSLLAPTSPVLYIAEDTPIKPFKPLIYAIGSVECSFDTLAYNAREQATGYFQIRPIRVNDYNKRTGSNYTLDDMYNYDKAETVFLYYASNIGPYNFERIAKNWNGSGKMTIDYWKRVNAVLCQ